MIALLLALQSHLPNALSTQTVSLNEGWKFVNMASQPSIWTGVEAVPTSQWKVISVSSQEAAGENAIASKAFDGNPKTFWHTKWFEGAASYPHELIIDLGVKTEAVGFRMLGRQTGPQNGRPNHIQVFLSNDRASWGTPIVADAVPNDSNLFQCQFPASTGRFLRLVVTDGHRGTEPFLAIAELGLIRNLDSKQKKDWESQYHIATVETGDARFDLKGDSLEKVKIAELSGMKDSAWKPAILPHAAWIRPLNKPEVWQGVTYYRRFLNIAPADLNKSLELSIGAAMQVSDLWLNGEHLATRRGGYLPLVANLSGKAKAHNELLVRLDNSDNPLLPPGKPQQDLDFMYGAGIHREAKLEIQNPVHIVRSNSSDSTETAPIVTTDYVIGTTCRLNMVTSIRNDSDRVQELKLVHELNVNFPNYSTVKVGPHSTKTVVDKMDVIDTILWSPSTPYLYQMKTRIMDANNRILDSYSQKFGVRAIKVSREHGFELNYKTLELVGTNRHQDYPWVGPALSRQANYRDAKLIKESGHNIVRLSHYPQSEEFLDACDELGILTIPCIAGWQFLNKDPRFENQVKQDIQELIQREASHPCVAWFETSLNET
ncbi:MAG: glycoside hydrolase family 2 TIM barrel-domain containing protein, partial [Armatimonadota bacterium]